jgi:phosphoglycolate phosphatase-like HAD superfamily hydrolase
MAGDGPKVIIFDFDGTLADSALVILDIFNEMADGFGYRRVAPEEIPFLRNFSSREVLEKFAIPKWKLFFIFRKGKQIFNRRLLKIPMVEGMAETLADLKKKNYVLGVLSSNTEKNVRDFLESRQIDVFDFVYSENNLFGKARALKKIMRRHGFRPEETVYVGDETRDVEAAKKSGLTAVAATWGFNSREALEKYSPDYLVDRPDELLKIF